eukprot:GILI01003051.1.p1 GENE.GILI01003051.1~~GILI01003051.1.p1  ORF type:complete len:274 (-),score=45.10 GILI01003051.1:204-1025(-)
MLDNTLSQNNGFTSINSAPASANSSFNRNPSLCPILREKRITKLENEVKRLTGELQAQEELLYSYDTVMPTIRTCIGVASFLSMMPLLWAEPLATVGLFSLAGYCFAFEFPKVFFSLFLIPGSYLCYYCPYFFLVTSTLFFFWAFFDMQLKICTGARPEGFSEHRHSRFAQMLRATAEAEASLTAYPLPEPSTNARTVKEKLVGGVPRVVPDESNEKTCVICLTNSPDVLFVPCGHLITCVACVSKHCDVRQRQQKCPICCTEVEDVFYPAFA